MKKTVKIIENRQLNREKIQVIQKIFFRILEKKIKEKKNRNKEE